MDDGPVMAQVRSGSADGARRRGPVAATALACVVVPLLVAAVVSMIAVRASGDSATSGRPETVDVDVYHATAEVTSTRLEQCEGTGEDRLPDGRVPETVDCLRVFVTVLDGAEKGRQIDVLATATLTARDLPVGTKVVVEHYPAADGSPEVWAWSDFARTAPLATLGLAFVAVTALVARWRGLRALLGLAIAFVVLWLYVLPGLVAGHNALVLALSASTVIMTAVLYLTHGLSLRTTTALVGTLTGLLLVAGLGSVGARASHLSGVTSEDDFQLAVLLGADGAATLRGVFLCGVILAGLGVLNDVTITQASAVWELHVADPGARWPALLAGGMRIGRDHIASTIYTIAFAYAGASLPVLLLLEIYDLPLARTLTSGQFAEEIVRTLAGSIGLVLAVPLTTLVASLVAVSSPVARHQATSDVTGGHAH
jgi:uncharacterized membrane protein